MARCLPPKASFLNKNRLQLIPGRIFTRCLCNITNQYNMSDETTLPVDETTEAPTEETATPSTEEEVEVTEEETLADEEETEETPAETSAE